MTIGAQIKEAREHAGLTLRELAEQSGVAFQTINRVENDKNSPSVELVEKILKPLGYRVTIEKGRK